jgi:hypothetical protein
MAEENPQPQNTGDQPSQAPQQLTQQQQPKVPQGQHSSGSRRNDRRLPSRHHGVQRDRQQSPRPAEPQKPEESAAKDIDIDEEEETEHDRSSSQGRHHYRGGRPPRKIIEEWANDPYCE